MSHFKENLKVVKNPPTLVVVILKVEGQAGLGKCKPECFSFTELRYQGTPNDNIAFSPFERQAFHKDPDKLYIF